MTSSTLADHEFGQAPESSTHDRSLSEPLPKLHRRTAFDPEHQDAPLRRPKPVVANSFPWEHRMSKLADDVLELALTRIVPLITQPD